MDQQNEQQEPETQAQWDLCDIPIFLRKETYQAIIAKQSKSNTIKKWLKYCKLKSLNNNVRNKEALQSHLLTYETGCSRAPPSIISGLVEKLIGPGIEEELKHCNVNYDPSKHISVASKKLLLRTTLTERQDGFHSRPKGSPIKKISADSRTDLEAQPPTLLNDSSDSSSEEEDEDSWDDDNSNTEKILELLKFKKNSPKTKSKTRNDVKSKPNSEASKQKTSDSKSKHVKEPLCCGNHGNNLEDSLKVLEKGIIRLQNEMKTQQTNLDFLAKELIDVKKGRNNDETRSLRKLFDDKYKILLETLNVQQTNLDNITDSTSKNDKNVSKLKSRLDSSVNFCQRTHEEHKNGISDISDSVCANSEKIDELRTQLDAIVSAQSDSPLEHKTANSKFVLENLTDQIEQLNKKFDLLSTKLQQQAQVSSVQSPQMHGQTSILLVMLCALWRENQELKVKCKIGNPPKNMTFHESTPSGGVADEPAEFLIFEDEIETRGKIERNTNKTLKPSGTRPPVPKQRHNSKTAPNSNKQKILPQQKSASPETPGGLTLHGTVEMQKQPHGNQETMPQRTNIVSVPGTSNETTQDKTGTRKVLLKTPSEHQTHLVRGEATRKKPNHCQTSDAVKTQRPEQTLVNPQITETSMGSHTQAKQKTTKIRRPEIAAKYTMTQGMKPRATENNTHHIKESQSSKLKTNDVDNQTNPSTKGTVQGAQPTVHKQRENVENAPTPNISRYRTHKCMIVHDPFLKDFDSEKFSKWFDVTNIQFYSLNEILSKGALVSKIKASKPEIIYLHAGFGDLLNKTKGDSIVEMYKQLIYKLLETSEVKICISLMIPVLGYPETNSKLKQINKCVSDFISQVRNQPKYTNRIFTSNNDVVGGFINRSVGPKGATVNLSDRGQKKMWIKVKDCLQRSLGHTPLRQHHRRNSTRNNTQYE